MNATDVHLEVENALNKYSTKQSQSSKNTRPTGSQQSKQDKRSQGSCATFTISDKDLFRAQILEKINGPRKKPSVEYRNQNAKVHQQSKAETI